MEIFLASDGRRLGPYSIEQVADQLKSGAAKLDDPAWYAGATDWVPLRQVPGIAVEMVKVGAKLVKIPRPPLAYAALAMSALIGITVVEFAKEAGSRMPAVIASGLAMLFAWAARYVTKENEKRIRGGSQPR